MNRAHECHKVSDVCALFFRLFFWFENQHETADDKFLFSFRFLISIYVDRFDFSFILFQLTFVIFNWFMEQKWWFIDHLHKIDLSNFPLHKYLLEHFKWLKMLWNLWNFVKIFFSIFFTTISLKFFHGQRHTTLENQ